MLANNQVNGQDLGLAPSNATMVDILRVKPVLRISIHQLANGLDGVEILEDAVQVTSVADVLETDRVRDRTPLQVLRMARERSRSPVRGYRPKGIRNDRRLCLSRLGRVSRLLTT